MSRYSNSTELAHDSPPSETWLFAQAILGRPIPSILSAEVEAKTRRAELERLAPFSPRHARELRVLQAGEAQARRSREVLQWAAGISTQAGDQLRTLQQKEADEREARHRAARFYESYSASLTEWDEADHPRAPKGTPIGGRWTEKGGGGGGANTGSGRPSSDNSPSVSGEDKSHMLALSHAWSQTKDALEQARRDIEELPHRIARDRAQFGTGGRYAYVHPQSLAKAQRDLENARALVPELEKQLTELQQEYHRAGYDDVPYSTFTPAETFVGGKGIEQVGRAVAQSGTPRDLQTTGIEFEIASAAVGGPAILRLGKALLGKAGLKKGAIRPALGKQVAELHGTLDRIAQTQRTTAVLETRGGARIVASGGRDLTPAQKALLGPTDMAAKSPGAHAEVTALEHAIQKGLRPTQITASRPFCPECIKAIEAAGGKITGSTTAVFPR